jgi:hypothetical protein
LPVVLTEARKPSRREAAESDFEGKPFQGRQSQIGGTIRGTAYSVRNAISQSQILIRIAGFC